MANGTLALVKGSHRLPFKDRMESCELPVSWKAVCDDCDWQTNDYEQGDVVVFDSRVIHGSFM